METVAKPFVLVVDDEPDSLRADVAAGLGDHAEHEVLHPREVELVHLERADLVLVDSRLDDWNERDAQESIALKPATGMALAVVLREHVDRSGKDRLTAFALHTAHLDDLRGRLPAASAQHVLARFNNLEWAFPKAGPRRYDQMLTLAVAVHRLPRKWPDGEEESASHLQSLLGLREDAAWLDRCWREVLECQAPVHELRDGGHGLMLVRWLLHQVMPYPCFLSEAHWVAARLQISHAELQSVVNGDSPLAKDLESMQYSGLLAGFLGRRWWRGALEDYVWQAVGARAADAQLLRVALQDRAGRGFGAIEASPPVVCLGPDLQPTGQFGSPTTAIRLRPDHWPAFADTAWTTLETAKAEPALAAMVDPLDRERLCDESEE